MIVFKNKCLPLHYIFTTNLIINTKNKTTMSEEKVIEMLTKQNERLMQIIEMFASKEQHIVVNSYNGGKNEMTDGRTTNNSNTSISGNEI